MNEEMQQKMDEAMQALKENAHLMLDDKTAPIYFELQKINEHLAKIAEKEMPEMCMEMPEVQKMEIVGAQMVTIKGEKGDTGERGEKGESIVGPQGERGERGEVGPMGPAGRDGKDGESIVGPAGKDGLNGSPDTGEQIIDKINSDESEKVIKKEKVEGFEDEIKRLDQKIDAKPTGGGTSAMAVARAFKYIAHTEQPTGAINGSNTTYRVTKAQTIWWIAGFTLNGEQIAELPNFTYSGNTITFSSALPSAYSGKDFEVKYIGT